MVVGGRTAVEVYFGLAMSGKLTGVKIFRAGAGGISQFCGSGI